MNDPGMKMVTQAFKRVGSGTMNPLAQSIRSTFRHIEKHELPMVRRQVSWGTRSWLRPFAFALNWLSNGWLYLFIVAGLLLLRPPDVFLVITAAALAAGGAHAIYPWIKRVTARPRPCDIDPSLKPMLDSL